MVSKSSNLTIRVNEETTGPYYCKASTAGFADISAEAYVYVKGKPQIRRQPIQLGAVGDSIRLNCLVYSVPMPETVVWSFDGHDISTESTTGYSVSKIYFTRINTRLCNF